MNSPLVLRRVVMASVVLLSATRFPTILCAGIVPDNSLKIPTTRIGSVQDGGITETEFNDVLDSIEKKWAPVIEARGEKLHIIRDWESPVVNASADMEFDGTRQLYFYGGLARHHVITKDAFLLVACHELGHHLGGAPKTEEEEWASNEGQADYFGTLRCLRAMWIENDNSKFLAGEDLDPTLKTECQSSYPNDPEQALCVRAGIAGKALANLFADPGLSGGELPQFGTPDPHRVVHTVGFHPAPQCRLDTYFNGALCGLGADQPLSNTDPHPGTCFAGQRQSNGFGERPACWFADDT